MARIQYNQLASLPDALDASAFELLLGSIPGAGSTDDLTLKCMNVALSGFSNEAFEVALHAHVMRFRGRPMTPRSLSVTYIEDSNFATYRKLYNWHELIAGRNSATSFGYRNQYSITAQLVSYDTTGRAAGRQTFEKFFLQDLQDAQFDGSSSQPLQISVTFSFDRMNLDGVPAR